MRLCAFIAMLSMMSAAATGCRKDPYYVGQQGHWERPDGGPGEGGIHLDGCVPTSATELCDGLDNDCDGLVDEGFDLQQDPRNCGACGIVCSFAHAEALCVAGECVPGSCQPGFWDLNGDPADDCEYNCQVTNGGVEACDGVDNDCNGQVDEGFDLDTDPENCGACGRACADLVGAGQTVQDCAGGVCRFQCDSGLVDLDGDGVLGSLGNGCEYACTPSGGGVETCDGVDNDCDGQVDEAPAGGPLTESCYTGLPASTQGVGVCVAGMRFCTNGAFGPCVGEIVPSEEVCDGLDNNCDGQVDETFDLDTDPENCGACDHNCWSQAPPNTIPSGCSGGVCQYICLYGFGDVDGDLQAPGSNGCEYSCPVLPPSSEVCDGLDNDCDGQVDQGLTPPPGLCYQGVDGPGPGIPGSPQNNPCRGVTAACTDQDGPGPLPHGWYCAYPAAVAVDPDNPNRIIATESVCDGLDNDCDGVPDDDFGVGQTCYAGVGGCRRAGTMVCTADQAGAQCDAVAGTPEPERCDGVDNDCDLQVDELEPGDPDIALFGDFVYVPSGNFTIFAFEASRPSADATDEGFDNGGVPCSRAGVMPWSGVTAVDVSPFGDVTASEACQRLGPGWDLCTASQWYEACAGGAYPTGGEAFPYGTLYDPNACNGFDYGVTQGSVQPRPTGDMGSCTRYVNGSAVYDMSGNLKEWVSNGVDFELRGGAYNTVSSGGAAPALQCDGLSPLEAGTEVHLPSVGFRCCYAGNLFVP